MTSVGVDIDTWKVTLCALNAGDPPSFETAPLRRSGESLLDAIRQTSFSLPLACARLDILSEPQVEFHVERGRGQHRKADFDLGAIYGAVIVALARACPGAHIASMTIPEWKKAVTGAVGLRTQRGELGLGNVRKDVANDACRLLLAPIYPAALDLGPDALDAYGLAYAAENRAERS